MAELTKILEKELWDLHRLHLKQEREILAASTYSFNSYERMDIFGTKWNIVSEARVLGPILTSNGSCNLDVKRGIIQINKAFWANSKFLINEKIPIEKRLEKLNSMAGGIIRSRGAAWIPSRGAVDILEKAQNKLIKIMLKVKRRPGETPDQYNLRRNRMIKNFKKVSWALIHLEASISWLAHMQRHPDDYSSRLLRFCKHWVAENRSFNNAGGSRTFSRSNRGHVFRFDHRSWTSRFSPEGSRDKKARMKLARDMFEWVRQSPTSLSQ